MVSFKLYKFAPKGVLPTRPQGERSMRRMSCFLKGRSWEQQRNDQAYDNDNVESPLPNVRLLHPLSERASNAPAAAIRFLPDASLIPSDRWQIGSCLMSSSWDERQVLGAIARLILKTITFTSLFEIEYCCQPSGRSFSSSIVFLICSTDR